MKTNETTKSTGLRDAVIGSVLVAVGLHVATVFPPLAFGMIVVGAFLTWTGITTK